MLAEGPQSWGAQAQRTLLREAARSKERNKSCKRFKTAVLEAKSACSPKK
jgi:hypothetical protein